MGTGTGTVQVLWESGCWHLPQALQGEQRGSVAKAELLPLQYSVKT